MSLEKTIRSFVISCVFVCGMATSSCTVNNSSSSPSSQQNEPTTCLVTFDSNGGTEVSSQEVNAGRFLFKPENPTRVGYTFNGWVSGEKKWIFIAYIVTKDMTLTAGWTAKTYTVSFDPGEGVCDTLHAIYTYDSEVTLPTPTYPSHTFLGWYFNDVIVSSGLWKIDAESIVLVASWKTGGDPIGLVTGDYLEGYSANGTYSAFLNHNMFILNNAITSHSEETQHIANFVDGLVENDEFGRLRLALASKAEVNSTFSEYIFTIKEGIPWLQSDGTQYYADIEWNHVPQYVTAEDFRTTIQHTLDFRDVNLWSDNYYLPAKFLRRGWEYWAYTYIQYRMAIGKFRDYYNYYYGTDATLQILTNPTADQIAKNAWCYAGLYGNVWEDEVPTGSDLPAIANFSRVGVEALEDGRLKFTLNESMPYFASSLTEPCFLPMNANFVDDVGYSNFGWTKDDFLYNGAYLLSTWNESTISYVKNSQYWDAANVHVNHVNYTILDGDLGYDYTRTKFEEGEVDEFTISHDDATGWETYIAGLDNSGTLINPTNDEAYSRFVEGVDSSNVMVINMDRTTEPVADQSSNLTNLEIVNANKAVKLDAVRSILLNGIDMSVYNQRFGATKIEQEQMQINTLIPRNFCLDSAHDLDYVDYVYEAYAEKRNISIAAATAKLAPGQTAGNNTSISEFTVIRAQLLSEVSAFNAANPTNAIAYPIKVEYLGRSFDPVEFGNDTAWIETANERINGVTKNAAHATPSLPLATSYPYVEIVNNTHVVDEYAYETMGTSGYYNMYVTDWKSDYTDPLAYLNAFVTGGGLSSFTNTDEPMTTYSADVMGNLTSRTMLEHYDELVAEGRAINDDLTQRYTKFAEAEVELIYEQHLIRPLNNSGQKWEATVSKTIGFERPQASCSLSRYKLKGMWVLTDIIGTDLRNQCQATYEAKKASLDPSYTIFS